MRYLKTVVLLILVAILGGCTVYNKEIIIAIEKCTPNDGIYSISPSYPYYTVTCNNGATFIAKRDGR